MQEAKHVNKLVNQVFDHEMGLRAEVERWMMRNEEMEQRLVDYAQKTRIMTIVRTVSLRIAQTCSTCDYIIQMLADCQAAVKITQEQRDAEKKLTEILEKEYDSALEYLKMENNEKDRFIKTLLDSTQQTAFETINKDMQKMKI